MSATASTTTDVAAYLARVRAALADLPAGDQDELLADLESHLTEVAGEQGEGTLESRLGPPEEYAAELRTAAGLPARSSVDSPGAARRVRELADRPWVRSTVDFLPELQPGWWVLRGVLAALLPTLLLGLGVAYVLLLGIVAVPLSVWLGRRGRADRRLRWAGIAASAVAVAAGLVLLGSVGQAGLDPAPGVEYLPGPDYGGLGGVTNIYPYSADGKPLTDVLLYDQDGRPVAVRVGPDADGTEITAVPRYAVDGRVVGNVYPQEQTVTDYTVLQENGEPTRRKVVPPAITPPRLAPR